MQHCMDILIYQCFPTLQICVWLENTAGWLTYFSMHFSYCWNISNECSLFCFFSQWTCVYKCLGLFDCSKATSGSFVVCKPVEEVLVYSAMINQRARARSWTSHQLQWPKAENPEEKYSYPQLNIYSVSVYGYRSGACSNSGFQPSVFAALQHDVQLPLNAMISWSLQGAAGECSLPFTASIKSHLSSFLVHISTQSWEGLTRCPHYQLQTDCIKWKIGLKCAVMWQTLLMCVVKLFVPALNGESVLLVVLGL